MDGGPALRKVASRAAFIDEVRAVRESRRDNNFSRRDFSSLDLSDLDLSGLSFLDSTFHNVQADNTVFDRCVMAGATFTNVAATGASFQGAILIGAIFQGCVFNGVCLDGVSLKYGQCLWTVLDTVSMTDADVQGIVVTGSVWVCVDGAGSSFDAARFQATMIHKLHISRARFRIAEFFDMHLTSDPSTGGDAYLSTVLSTRHD